MSETSSPIQDYKYWYDRWLKETTELEKQLAAVTSELEVTSKHRDNAVDELRYGAIETVKQLDAVSEKVINDLKAQLAVVVFEKEAAIKEANRTNQKWQDGINECESALTGVWDGHYSRKGVSALYAQAVDIEVKNAIRQLGTLKGKYG